jgi:hypothetical protein
MTTRSTADLVGGAARSAFFVAVVGVGMSGTSDFGETVFFVVPSANSVGVGDRCVPSPKRSQSEATVGKALSSFKIKSKLGLLRPESMWEIDDRCTPSWSAKAAELSSLSLIIFFIRSIKSIVTKVINLSILSLKYKYME